VVFAAAGEAGVTLSAMGTGVGSAFRSGVGVGGKGVGVTDPRVLAGGAAVATPALTIAATARTTAPAVSRRMNLPHTDLTAGTLRHEGEQPTPSSRPRDCDTPH
jgi:hypothetical protein